MIKVLLNGCNGRMGKVVSECIKNYEGIMVSCGVDRFKTENSSFPVYSNFDECNEDDVDVIIDFSSATATESLLEYAKEKKIPVVLCSTGFTPDQIEYINQCALEIPLFKSGNMSIGINVISNILKKVAPFLYDNFDIEIIEKHHNQKLDSPSGTALLLANSIKSSIPSETNFTYGREGIAKRDEKEIGIHAVRGGNIVGDHDVIFAGAGEVIEINHKAISRDVFAHGAIKAAEFLVGQKPGLYNMDNVINFS